MDRALVLLLRLRLRGFLRYLFRGMCSFKGAIVTVMTLGFFSLILIPPAMQAFLKIRVEFPGSMLTNLRDGMAHTRGS